jgi:RNA polymerase sigma factor (sigma-70 family)
MNVSPQPQLLDRARRGDEQARNQVVQQVSATVGALVSRMRIPPGSQDDLVQEALLGLLRRLPQFDPARGRFQPWLSFTVRTLIMDHLRSYGYTAVRLNRRQLAARREEGLDLAGMCVSLDDERPGHTGSIGSVLESHAAPHTEAVERRDFLDSAMELVTATERRVLDLLYPRDGTPPVVMRRAGEMLNVSESRIAQLRARAIERMRAGISTAAREPVRRAPRRPVRAPLEKEPLARRPARNRIAARAALVVRGAAAG